MKKLLTSIGSFFASFAKRIDKLIIVPITSGFLFVYNKIKNNSKYLEGWLSKRNTLIFVSLFISLLFFVFIDTKSRSLIETSAEILYNQPVNVIYNSEAYVIEGLQDKVDITLIGNKADIYLAKQIPSRDVTVDLTGLKPGTHSVQLEYTQPISSISYKLDPSTATVVIYEKISDERELSKDIINADDIDEKYIIDDVKMDINSVYIKGKEKDVSSVSSVKALIDLSNLTMPSVGDNKVDDITLIAYNEKGVPIDVEIVPNKISANVEISSPNKEVPIKIIPIGDLAFGSAIGTMTSSIGKVTIYGVEENLKNIEYIPVEVDVSELNYTDNPTKKYTLSINKPSGIKYINSTTTTVNLSIEKAVSDVIEEVYIESINLGDGLTAAAVDQNQVDISITGVEEVLNSIDEKTVRAVVDLKGLGIGTHTVKVQTSGDDLRVTYTPKTTTVEIRITEA